MVKATLRIARSHVKILFLFKFSMYRKAFFRIRRSGALKLLSAVNFMLCARSTESRGDRAEPVHQHHPQRDGAQPGLDVCLASQRLTGKVGYFLL